MNNIDEFLKLSEVLSLKLNNLKNKNILITGATGLIGSYLLKYLTFLNNNNGYNINIHVITRKKNKAKLMLGLNDENIIERDLNEYFKIDYKYDYVIHLASNAHPIAFSTDPVGTMKTNLLATMCLLDSIKNTNAKFLYASSGEIYGNNSDHYFKEDDIGTIDNTKIRSCYPESKRAAETLCLAYNKQFNQKINILRLCYIYGSTITDDNSRADAQFLRNAINGEDIVLKSKGLQKRTYCYVADAVGALLHILINDFDGEIFNIANPDSIASVYEYAKTLAQIANVNIRFELPDEIEKRGYSKQADSVLDASKLINSGFKPIYSLKEGLYRTYLFKKGEINA